MSLVLPRGTASAQPATGTGEVEPENALRARKRPGNCPSALFVACTIIILIMHDRIGACPENAGSQEEALTAGEHPVCDCPEPCGCYAAGKDKAYFEVLASLEGPPHAGECACQPCQVKRACLRKVMTLMVRSSPAFFELMEVWALEDQATTERQSVPRETQGPVVSSAAAMAAEADILADARAEARSWSPSTRCAYAAGWKDFTRSCIENRCAGMPAVVADLGLYPEHRW